MFIIHTPLAIASFHEGQQRFSLGELKWRWVCGLAIFFRLILYGEFRFDRTQDFGLIGGDDLVSDIFIPLLRRQAACRTIRRKLATTRRSPTMNNPILLKRFFFFGMGIFGARELGWGLLSRRLCLLNRRWKAISSGSTAEEPRLLCRRPFALISGEAPFLCLGSDVN